MPISLREGGEEAMEEPDLQPLWETKKNADILLTMGGSKWELHDKFIRGKSGLIDHILEMVEMVSSLHGLSSREVEHDLSSGVPTNKRPQKEGVRKIPLKEHMFPYSALNTVLKYFYFGESLIADKTDVIDLLSLYEVSATLAVLPLQEVIASQAGTLLGEILSSSIGRIGDFYIVIEVIIAEQDDAWVPMHEEMQRAIEPHLPMLLQHDTFVNLIKQHQGFCLEILLTAIGRIETLENAGKKTISIKDTSDIDLQANAEHSTGVSKCFGTQTDIPLPHTPKKSFPTATVNDAHDECSIDETTPRPRKREPIVASGTEAKFPLDEPNRRSHSIPRSAKKSGTDKISNSTSKDSRLTQIPQNFKFDFEAKSAAIESVLAAIDQSNIPSLSETSRETTAHVAAPLVRPGSSTSYASTHWESCSGGGERTVPVIGTSKPIAPPTSVEPSSQTVAAPKSQSQDEKTTVVFGNNKHTTLESASLNFFSHVQEEHLPMSTTEGSSARQTKQTAIPAIHERSSHSYAFNNDSLPQGFQFSGGPQRQQPEASSSKATTGHVQEEKTTITGVVKKARREYVLSGSSVSQSEGTAAPAIPDRLSRSYTFNSESLPRSFQFSGRSQEHRSAEPSIKTPSASTTGSRTHNTKAPTSCAQQSTSSSSQARATQNPAPAPSIWKADRATRKQIRKGRLIVELPDLPLTINTETSSSSRPDFSLDGDDLEKSCRPS
ncbi:hypothetical protein CSAL01_04922 [Colletotrichum salicis]|uniref:BTB domain-containing protein n=1 Tax=Colletotrichum salicis TaxID=1209931 RepID=A0A135RPV6_9PEZI|nr:hypothetical protein CSAL01_04922 [Colletotrichum salicis]